MTLTFLLTTLIIVASPGTGVLYTVAAALSRGTRASLIAAVACTLGIVPHLFAALFGLAALLHASGVAFSAVKYAGVAYLLYMAWKSLRDTSALRVDTVEDRRPVLRVLIDGVLINMLNPKLSIFFVAFLPQFIGPHEANPLLKMIEMSGVFMLMTLLIFAVYGVFAAALRGRVLSQPGVIRWLRRTFAATFVGLAVKLALAER